MRAVVIFLLFLSFAATAQVTRTAAPGIPVGGYLFSPQASVVQDTVFYNIYGGNNQDEAHDFVETSDKGFLLCGSSSSFGQGTSSIYVVKTDSMGRYKWGRTYGGINIDRGMSIRNTPDHGAYVCGYTNSFNNLEYDAYCARIDSAGNLLWEKTYSGDDWDFVYSSAVLPDGGLVMAGETYSNTAGDADAWLIRINQQGDTLWTRKLGTPYAERFKAVTVFNNSIYTCGRIYDVATSAYLTLIARYSFSGALIDSSILSGQPNINYEMLSIEGALYGHLFLGGGIVDPTAPSGAQQGQIQISIDTTLAVLWSYAAGTLSATEYCSHVFEDNRQHLMATMTKVGGNGGTAMFLGDFNAGGGYIFGQTYGGLQDEFGVKGMITSRNKLAFLGNTYSWGFGDEDYWLVLFKADTLIPDAKVKFHYYNDTTSLNPFALTELNEAGAQLFPNPVSKNETLALRQHTGWVYTSFELIDQQGRLVRTGALENALQTRIDLSGLSLATGIYFVRLKGDQQVHVVKISVQD